MATSSNAKTGHPDAEQPRITRVTVAGYKSIRDEQSIEIRPLTILAGANSSGKSSMVQPLLLLKQTLEATYDPGPLLLAGPNVRFTEARQLLSRAHRGEPLDQFHVALEFAPDSQVAMYFRKPGKSGFEVTRVVFAVGEEKFDFTAEMDHAEIREQLPSIVREHWEKIGKDLSGEPHWQIERERCFLRPMIRVKIPTNTFLETPVIPPPLVIAEQFLRNIVHLPALRGNPRRTYPVTAVGPTFSGTFDTYAASVIAKWQGSEPKDALEGTWEDLKLLGLSWIVLALPISDAEVELQVGRLPRAVRGGARDFVSIADVGFGVSQALPVVVALHAASREQWVYLEQPEIHLHPRAQVSMADVLARAVKRGVRVVVETHSGLLLRAVQHLVARGDISPELVKLHWFTRSDNDGATKITSADLDEAGAFGDWPEDFGDVELDIEKRYLDAAEAKMSRT